MCLHKDTMSRFLGSSYITNAPRKHQKYYWNEVLCDSSMSWWNPRESIVADAVHSHDDSALSCRNVDDDGSESIAFTFARVESKLLVEGPSILKNRQRSTLWHFLSFDLQRVGRSRTQYTSCDSCRRFLRRAPGQQVPSNTERSLASPSAHINRNSLMRVYRWGPSVCAGAVSGPTVFPGDVSASRRETSVPRGKLSAHTPI